MEHTQPATDPAHARHTQELTALFQVEPMKAGDKLDLSGPDWHSSTIAG